MTAHTNRQSSRQCDALIIDLGDVLFGCSAKTRTSIAPETMRRALRSSAWFEYEKGQLTENQCYTHIASMFVLSPSDVAEGIHAARASTRSDPTILGLLRNLQMRTGVRVFAMTNISAPDWDALACKERTRAEDNNWALFERVFTSFAAGERKPNLGFYRHVLEATGIDPRRTAFVDSKIENVVSAMSFGMKGVVLNSIEELSRSLWALLRNPVEDAERWMHDHAKKMWSVTNTGVIIEENFAQLLLLEVTRDWGLVDIMRYPGRCNFFRGKGVLTTVKFPDDLDTTSMACTILEHYSRESKDSIMDEMLALRNRDGILQTYFDNTRPRTDPTVAVNVLTFFHLNGRGHELSQMLDWVYDVLVHRAYDHGTLYYHSGDAFLYFLSRLLQTSALLHKRFSPLFAERVRDRFGAPGDPLALAMRIIAAASMGLRDVRDHEQLLMSQEDAGCWPVGWFYRNGSTGILTGNQGLTTALAVAAIHQYQALEIDVHVESRTSSGHDYTYSKREKGKMYRTLEFIALHVWRRKR